MEIQNKDILKLLERELKNKSQTKLALDIGIKVQYLNDVLHGRTNPGPTILQYFGYRKREIIESAK
jgi:transcriptional regulator with XRE-family HTH domain